MKAARLVFGAAGIALLTFGVFRLLTQIGWPTLIGIATWLVLALIIHDGLVSPLIIAVAVVLRRLVPDRARRYLQFALIAGAMITVIAVPMIIRRNSEPPEKALLLQPYGLNLTIILVALGVATLTAYAIRVARDHQPVSKR